MIASGEPGQATGHPPSTGTTSVRSAAVGLRKRTQRQPIDAPARAPASSVTALAVRDEKILLMLAIQTQQINDRLTRLEDRFEASLRDSLAQPDQQDLLELRLHSARLAAELSRVALELRAEINQLASSRGEVIDLTALDAPTLDDEDDLTTDPGAPPHRRVDDPLDLGSPTGSTATAGARPRPRPRRTSGWRPVRASTPPEPDAG